MDPITATFTTFGLVLAFLSWVYLMFVAFEHDFSWGLLTVFLPPLAYIYAIAARFRDSKAPLALLGVGLVCLWIA